MFESLKKQIPNLFTLANLSCGVMAIVSVLESNLNEAALFIFAAVFFDFFDGFLARLLKVSGELGKQLDSLADLVTFGVAPALILYDMSLDAQGWTYDWLHYAFILVAIFSAYRLAKFNIDTRQSDSFIGVPTPITGVMIASWVFIYDSYPSVYEFIFYNQWIFAFFCIVVSLLLISEIPLISLKIKKGKSIHNYYPQLVLIAIGIVSFLIFNWLAFPIIYVVYVLSSVFINFAKK
ncbi:MAG: CDP-diacylglycerol--serine O-phosphatidyltransferase [Bacteroidota bacterium]|nr:CDP-diacylglycerol--serine O-phosphatidyltransferase [Bacteroidota bacterium]